MSSQKLKMTYHPAKKEVLFERFGAEGTPVTIRSDSKLYKYMNKKGQFILQDHGDAFFEDIAKAFDGESSVDMEVVTTKSDFGDFEQMVEYYNEGHSVKINATLLAELPDMNTTYTKVKEHGEKAIAILKKHREDFHTIQTDTPAVKESIDSFSQEVYKASALIREKIDCMGDNNINLCFAGVYSTGKSTLINAILGYRILPEAIHSETARMFEIKSPQKGEPVKIIFEIEGFFSELIWNEKTNVFEFGAAPTENMVREDIQKVINSVSHELQHVQVFEILKKFNCLKDVGSVIKIRFPIPLDTPSIQFTIYDTPGADSNYLEHQEVLKDALAEQTHSILVFVAAPNKLEGSGNNALLSYLKDAEEKDSKTSIDIGRSLFVINLIDSFNDPEQRQTLREAKIVHKKKKEKDGDTDSVEDSGEEFSIALANKKLFFTSALYGYAAKAKENQVSTPVEDRLIKNRYNEVVDEEDGRYYSLNHVATSECATKKLLAYCDEAMERALADDDRLTAMRIGSGVYALEREILNYGEKYAGAVKAFAIIDSVDKALSVMSRTAKSLDQQNQEDISTVTREIEQLRTALKESIAETYKRYEIKDGKLPDEVIKVLHLDADYLYQNINQPTMSFIEKLLKGWFFGLGKVKAKESHKADVKQKIKTILSDYTREFLKTRQTVLEKVRDSFIEEIQTVIRNNGNISEQAKAYVCEIIPPEVKKATNLVEFGDIYDSNRRTENVLFWERTTVDKESFKEDVTSELATITGKMASDFTEDYKKAVSTLLNQVQAEFVLNMDNYSILMKAKLSDKKAMEELHKKIVSAEEALLLCQQDLNSTIWSVNNNG
ncbi:dynamin family protein [Intestinimonas sp. MSJ-38]|uniref:dynamin family protein n=1 Tax=Intestinimonas sp. MSJ-38 TaxID=2841532 RepID=UPI001C0FE910|nr:dynamin family protein [Intestinimonas sp. MSJ-38]MBU5432190.1 dynamin family protein [Intestinimonas sp. MSJ-38]